LHGALHSGPGANRGVPRTACRARARGRPTCSSAVNTFSLLADELPFVQNEELLAHDITYSGFGFECAGRDSYAAACTAWQRELPTRLHNFHISDKTFLPADSRGVINGRYKISFLAPVPPQLLPAQRARVMQANLTRTTDGLVAVCATIACTVQLDKSGRVRAFTEYLAIDPFAVTATIAHFELCYARTIATLRNQRSPLAITRAYWAALRELTRRELEEVKRQAVADDDELRALDGGGELSDGDFERWFAVFVVRNFAVGSAIGALAYVVLRTVRDSL